MFVMDILDDGIFGLEGPPESCLGYGLELAASNFLRLWLAVTAVASVNGANPVHLLVIVEGTPDGEAVLAWPWADDQQMGQQRTLALALEGLEDSVGAEDLHDWQETAKDTSDAAMSSSLLSQLHCFRLGDWWRSCFHPPIRFRMVVVRQAK